MASEQLSINNPILSTEKPSESKQVEIRALLALLILANLDLLLGNAPATKLVFHPQSIIDGDWWRVISWPFVHVSRYHLLIDGAAFIMLYHGLREESRRSRVFFILSVAAGSLLLPIFISPQISQLGLCGLSGPAHGLMAISSLEFLHGKEKKTGGLLLALLLLKTGWEVLSGNVFLHQLHLGDIGQPIVSTHAGGVLAGLTCYYVHFLSKKTLFRRRDIQKQKGQTKS
ncbi:rhomboid family GlyGly-CTERM serine protease [Malonomonas rubra DSM 5091]|uniref:Rhomboid family GlyGly-CTERM serine protease n=1 Tax=Malonomonas rubra DSM 5091 TaxID=1122189 RepID=A0A1M6CJN6_MALRU|nr:rhombosortase [Malonomonas rubra]SHI60908.1 rhomboid family GlyGly-CTERM serine protease [Malonomonas rubra DSM 5091]